MSEQNIHLVRQRYTPFGGAERFVARALQALEKQGVTITLVTRSWEAEEGAPASMIKCDPFYLGRLWRDWSFARAACKHVGSNFVQSHERIPCCDLYRAGDGVHREWLAQRGRTMSWMGRFFLKLSLYHHYVRWAEKRMFLSSRLRGVICNSKMVQQEIVEYFALPPEMLHVIYSGVDIEKFHPRARAEHKHVRAELGINDNAVLYLLVGSGYERKGVGVLLEALVNLPDEAVLLVVGKEKKLAKFRRQAAALGLDKRVIWLGGQKSVLPYYGAADVFVLPALYDPFPNVVLEAMACGLPVVTSFKCGAQDFIEDGKNGFLVDALDQEALTVSLQKLMDGGLREQLGRAAREQMVPYTLEAMGERLNGLYDGLVVKSSPDAP